MQIKVETKPFTNRLGEPKQINLKQFYQLSDAKRHTHIEELKNLKFNELSDTDKGVVFFYYQNWLLEDWPGKKENFFEIEQDISTVFQQVVETVDEKIVPTVDKICENGLVYVREYLNAYFELDYPDWEGNLKFNSANKFCDATLNFMILDDLTIVHIYAYKKLLV